MTESPAPDPHPESTGGFADLGVRPEVLSALVTLGYEEATPIQRETIPPLISGRDLLGQAATGTGKTAAFALPILERLVKGAKAEPIALVLVPTRELAVQVSEAIYKYGRDLNAQVLPIYGGQPITRQLQVLRRGVHVVVATPGRAIDHINRRTLPLDNIEMVVLDEADEMLDMGFAEDLEAILGALPSQRQTVLFSATMPRRIDALASKHLTDPVRIAVGAETAAPGEAPLVSQRLYIVARAHKAAALGRILDVESPDATIVFCRTRTEVDQLAETLNGRGYRAEALHGGMDQEQRDRVMGRLRAGVAELLVATDVAARGLDIDLLTHVVNYDVPSAPESYVHRIGRVGRAGRQGVAITLAEPRERRLISNVERVTGQTMERQKIPSVADLRAARTEQSVGTLREILEAGDLDRFTDVVEALAEDFEPLDIARAALALAHQEAGTTEDHQEIPDASARPDRKSHDRKDRGGDRWNKGERERPNRDRGGNQDRGERGDRGPRQGWDKPPSGSTRLYVGIGRGDGARPGDLVGAIAGESGLSGRDIGAIKIFDRFSLVDVPATRADDVIEAMRSATVRGKRPSVRRDRES